MALSKQSITFRDFTWWIAQDDYLTTWKQVLYTENLDINRNADFVTLTRANLNRQTTTARINGFFRSTDSVFAYTADWKIYDTSWNVKYTFPSNTEVLQAWNFNSDVYFLLESSVWTPTASYIHKISECIRITNIYWEVYYFYDVMQTAEDCKEIKLNDLSSFQSDRSQRGKKGSENVSSFLSPSNPLKKHYDSCCLRSVNTISMKWVLLRIWTPSTLLSIHSTILGGNRKATYSFLPMNTPFYNNTQENINRCITMSTYINYSNTICYNCIREERDGDEREENT